MWIVEYMWNLIFCQKRKIEPNTQQHPLLSTSTSMSTSVNMSATMSSPTLAYKVGVEVLPWTPSTINTCVFEMFETASCSTLLIAAKLKQRAACGVTRLCRLSTVSKTQPAGGCTSHKRVRFAEWAKNVKIHGRYSLSCFSCLCNVGHVIHMHSAS